MNFYRPQKRKRAKMGMRESSVIRCAGHLKFVRGYACIVSAQSFLGEGISCSGRVEAHHLQCFRASEGGMGLKVGDDRVIPLCCAHHEMIHRVGHAGFERVYGAGLANTAEMLWSISPHGKKYRLQQGERA